MNKSMNKVIKSHIFLAVLSVVAVVLMTGGLTYALFQMESHNTENQTIAIGNFSANMTSTSGAVILNDLYPEQEANVTTDNTKYPLYTFTVTNDGDYDIDYQIYLTDATTTFLEKTENSKYTSYKALSPSFYKYIRYKLDGNSPALSLESMEANLKTVILTGSMKTGASPEDHFIQFFLDENAPNDIQETIISLDIHMVATIHGDGNSPADQVIKNLHITPSEQTPEIPNFTKISPQKEEAEITANSKYTTLTNISNDATYPFTYDSATGTFTSTMKTDDAEASVSFSASTQENKMAICYEISSEQDYDQAFIYLDGVQKEVVSGEKTNCVDLGTVSSSNIIKVTYQKDSSSSSGSDEVKFYLTNDYTKVIKSIDDTGVYSLEDDDGISYFFRGDIKNNYVKFGQNKSGQDMYWRIIRVNGNGTIRMIYDGTSAHENGVYDEDRVAMTGVPWNTGNYNDNKYVGYMYGGANETASDKRIELGQPGYRDSGNTLYNETSTNIKTQLENWYKENIVDTNYHSYVADEIFCNDRSIPKKLISVLGDNTSATGIGTDRTIYGFWGRYDLSDDGSDIVTSASPSFKCPSETDKFTTKNATKGNRATEYPVGLITADEIVAAGASGLEENNKDYLTKGSWYWSFSPYFFSGSGAYVFNVDGIGYLGNYGVAGTRGAVAPVINLKTEYVSQLKGTGISSDPFRLS